MTRGSERGYSRRTHSRYVIGCCLIPLGIGGLKNNSRRITDGIGCVWRMPSLSPLSSLGRTLSCGMDANLVVDWRWAKYQIKLFTISQLLNLNPCCTYKKLPACKTAKILTAFLILRKKTIIVFNHVNTDWLIISLLNTVIEKKIKAWKTEYEDRQVAG